MTIKSRNHCRSTTTCRCCRAWWAAIADTAYLYDTRGWQETTRRGVSFLALLLALAVVLALSLARGLGLSLVLDLVLAFDSDWTLTFGSGQALGFGAGRLLCRFRGDDGQH